MDNKVNVLSIQVCANNSVGIWAHKLNLSREQHNAHAHTRKEGRVLQMQRGDFEGLTS